MKTWKKLLAMLMALAMVFALAACSSDSKIEEEEKEEKAVETTAPAEPGDQNDGDKEEAKEEDKEEAEEDGKVEKKEEEKETATEPEEEEEINIEGEWLAQLDLSEAMNDVMAKSTGGVVSVQNKPIFMNVELDVSGSELTMNVNIDVDSMKAYMAEFLDKMFDYALEMAEAQGLTIEDLEAQMGMSLEEAKEMFGEQMDEEIADALVSAFEGVSNNGYYLIDGNKLYIGDDKDTLGEEESYMLISMEDNVLIFEAMVNEDGEEIFDIMSIANTEFPWEFERR